MTATTRLRALLVVVLLLAAAACDAGSPQGAAGGGADDGSGGTETGGGGGGDGGGSLTFLHWRGEDSAVFDELLAQFSEETGIAVEQNVLPSDAYEGQAEAQLRGAGGADVFAVFPGSQFTALAGADAMLDLSDAEFADRFDPEYLEVGADDQGRQLAYPYQLVFNIPVYNQTMFDELGLEPPQDWDGFLALCDSLLEAEVTPILYAGDISGTQFINPMLMNNQPSDDVWAQVEAGEAQVTDEWFVTTLTQIAELRDRGCFQDDALGTRNEGAVAVFAQEQAGMLATGSYQMAQILDQNPDITVRLLAPLTVPAAEATYEGIHTTTFMLAVNAASDQQEQAQQLIEFLTRPQPASTYANQTGQLLTVSDVDYTAEALQSQSDWIERETLFQPRLTITVGALNDGLKDAVDKVVSGTDPQQAAEEYQALIDREVGG